MKKIAILFVFMNSFQLKAQTRTTIAFPSHEEITINEKQIANIKNANIEINGFEFDFSEKPKHILIDTNNLALIILSKSNAPGFNLLYNYSFLDGNVKWKLNTEANHIELYDSLIYLSSPDREFMIDSKTGKILWQQDSRIYHIGVSQKDILVSSEGSSLIKIIQASSGKSLWNKKTKKVHGINDVQVVNDSILLLALDGIFKINLNTGSEQYIEMKTSQKCTYGFLGGNALFSDKTSILCGYPNEVYICGINGKCGLSSNILNIKETVYFADNNCLYSFKLNDMSINWKNYINKKDIGVSRLYDCDSKISLLNLGVARHTGTYIKYNQPFFAILDKNTGDLIRVRNINTDEELRHLKEYENEILFLTKNEILKYDNQGNLLDSLYLDQQKLDTFGELRWVFNISQFKSKLYQIDSIRLNKLDSMKYIALTNKGFILFKKNLRDFSIFDYKSLGSVIFENNKIQLIAGVEIKKGIIFKKVFDSIYVIDKSSGSVLDNFKFKIDYISQKYLIGDIDRKVQIFKIHENEPK